MKERGSCNIEPSRQRQVVQVVSVEKSESRLEPRMDQLKEMSKSSAGRRRVLEFFISISKISKEEEDKKEDRRKGKRKSLYKQLNSQNQVEKIEINNQ